MRLAETVTFASSGLDRAAQLRRDPQELARLLALPEAGVLALWRGKPLIADALATTAADGGTSCPGAAAQGCWLPAAHPALQGPLKPFFLGLDDGAPRFALDISDWEPVERPDTLGAFHDPSEQRHPGIPEARFVELREVMAALSPREAELIVTARALTGWHRTHRFCSNCGAASQVVMGGWQRDCPACNAHHFPRTDPVVIMLVTQGDSVLLGRSPAWPEGMFSLLAGFIEPGETVEAAVRREVLEETGIEVGEVAYLTSQPWPFPASLMLGCRGEAAGGRMAVDHEELEHALWISREQVAAVLDGRHPKLHPPRAGSVARFLLRHWVADRLD